MTRSSFITAVVFLSACFGLASGNHGAQEQDLPAPTGLVLVVTRSKATPPSSIQVPGSSSMPIKFWTTQTKRTEPPVQAVNVKASKEDDAVKVEVSVFVGERVNEQEIPILTRSMRENEKISIVELEKLGIEPIEIELVRVAVAPPMIPASVSHAPSVRITEIEARKTTLPTYNVTIKNLSEKPVQAVGVELHVEGRKAMISWPKGKNGQPLIPPGETASFTFAGVRDSELKRLGDLTTPPRQEIVVTGAVFHDNSYEGDAEIAARFRSFQLGEKEQIARIPPLLRTAYGLTELDPQGSLLRLKEGVSALDTNIDPTVIDRFRQELPAGIKSNLVLLAESGKGNVRIDMYKEIQQLIDSPSQSSVNAQDLQKWLLERIERYELWLAKL
jgi:hypothetical protein